MHNSFFVNKTIVLISLLFIVSCNKFKEFTQKPELGSLQQGLMLSAATGYCVSIAISAYKGYTLPDNVIYNEATGLIYIKIDKYHPLPFNNNIGDIVIASNWHENAGLITILFGNLNVLNGNTKVNGLLMVPIIENEEDKTISAILFKEDIIVNSNPDNSVLNMSNISIDIYNFRMDRFNNKIPQDAYIAVKQNIWFININQNNLHNNVYDDIITINGGGQIVEIQGSSGGILYHALINSKIQYSKCKYNPISGYGLIQNFKAGGKVFIDLGNSLLSFQNTCDGKVHVDFSSGKYVSYFGKNISLDL